MLKLGKKSSVDLLSGDEGWVIFKFSVPIILSYLLQQIYTISDAAICGQTLGVDDIAGVNDVFPILFIFLQFAVGCTAGFSVITSIAAGRGDQARVRRSFAAQLVLGGVLSLALTGVAVLTLKPLLRFIGLSEANPGVWRAAYQYSLVIFLGIFAQLYYNLICSVLRSLGDSTTPLIFLLFSTVLNIGLDLLFILAFRLGVIGAAAATVVAQGISAVLCGWYIIRNYPALHFARNAFANGKKFAANMFWAGLSMGLMSAIYNIGSVVLQSSINALGSTYIAAQVAARRFAELFFIPGGALGIAVATYSSQNLGAGHRSRIMKGVTTALGIYFVWWVFVMLFVFFLSDPAVRAITGTNDEVIISNAVLYLKISAPVIPPMAVLVIVRNMLQGIQHTIEPLLASGLELIGKVIFGVWIVPAVGYTAVCFCEPVTWVICFVFILGALYRCRGELKDKE